ncbi:MAG TPA: hypothetical protein VF765_04095 [Polyangiaceae bacterium]
MPPATSDELESALVRAGGRVLARQAHGVLIAIRKRLVFVSSAGWVSASEIGTSSNQATVFLGSASVAKSSQRNGGTNMALRIGDLFRYWATTPGKMTPGEAPLQPPWRW